MPYIWGGSREHTGRTHKQRYGIAIFQVTPEWFMCCDKKAVRGIASNKCTNLPNRNPATKPMSSPSPPSHPPPPLVQSHLFGLLTREHLRTSNLISAHLCQIAHSSSLNDEQHCEYNRPVIRDIQRVSQAVT